MPHYTTEAIRNVALLGNEGAGKTSLTEALLCKSGAISAPGDVGKGTTVCDFDEQEKKHHHSLEPAVVGFDYGGAHVNLIDTPGYPDFIGRAMSVLPAVETAVIVVNARSGINMNTRRLMNAAAERGLCRMIVINQIDQANGDLEGLLEAITEEFGGECLPLNLPANHGQAVVDCLFESSGDGADFLSVDEVHTRIVDQVVELDEDLMERYLEDGESVSMVDIHDAFERAMREGHLIPVCFTSSETGAGVAELLEIITKMMPSPLEGNPQHFFTAKGDFELHPEQPDSHVLAHVFKVRQDAFAGKMSVFRIHQGTLKKNAQLFVGEARKPIKISHLFKLRGKEQLEIEEAVAGDICAISKVDGADFDAVLHDSHDEDDVHLTPVELPEPMFGIAITANSRNDQQKLSDALHKLAVEDPSLRVEHDAEMNQTVIRGLGDLHLRIVLEAIEERFNVSVNTEPPKIPYRETVLAAAEGHSRHKKQTGGAGQFGEVFLRIEPLERGAGFEFVDAVVGGVIPRQFIPAVEKGVRQVLEQGATAGYPIQDVRVTVYDGKHHPVDSKEVAFVAAARKAMLDAVSKGRGAILEPIVAVHITAPQEYTGDITGHLSSKRGRVSGTQTLSGGLVTVSAEAPLAELSSYQSELKSLTGGTGSYAMELARYEPVPANVQQSLVEDFSPQVED
ncbi:MAG: elongation factor G [Gammaproteobacteria bacterium]|nr:elongation factor G [Gammaproteobacteria bacterium]